MEKTPHPDFRLGAGGRLVASHPEGFVYMTPTPMGGWIVTTSFDSFASPSLVYSAAKQHAQRMYYPEACVDCGTPVHGSTHRVVAGGIVAVCPDHYDRRNGYDSDV